MKDDSVIRSYMKYFEQAVWTISLILLFFMDVSSQGSSVCVFKIVGFNSCVGCGLGHAIHNVLHLDFIQSLEEHILGIPVTIGILYTIIKPLISPKITIDNGSGRNVYDVAGNSAR